MSERRRPTRLLLVTNMYPTPDRPQIGAFVERRVAALRSRGVDVTVIAPRDYRSGTARRHLDLIWRALTARGPFDGVEAHPVYFAGLVALVAARLRRWPLLAYAHGGDVADYAVRSRIHGMLAGLVVCHANAIVANSADTARFVERLGGTARVISPGVDMKLFRPADVDRAELRRRLGLTESFGEGPGEQLAQMPLALFMGSISERKGADLFAAAVDATPGWVGAMLGQGPLAADIAAGHPSIRQFPPVPGPEVPSWLQAADAIVVPSRREPLGLAAVEALACGTPVIAASVGGLREVVQDGGNGLLVAPEDAGAISAALVCLLDPELRRRLGAAAPVSVTGHDVERAAAEMAEVWQKLGVKA